VASSNLQIFNLLSSKSSKYRSSLLLSQWKFKLVMMPFRAAAAYIVAAKFKGGAAVAFLGGSATAGPKRHRDRAVTAPSPRCGCLKSAVAAASVPPCIGGMLEAQRWLSSAMPP